VVFGRFVVADCDRSDVFELVKEAHDEVVVAVDERTERGNVTPLRHRPDVGPGSAFSRSLARSGRRMFPAAKEPSISQAARPSWAWPSVSLSTIGRPSGVDERMDFRRQAARRATHATGSVIFFGCWQHADEHGCWTRTNSPSWPPVSSIDARLPRPTLLRKELYHRSARPTRPGATVSLDAKTRAVCDNAAGRQEKWTVGGCGTAAIVENLGIADNNRARCCGGASAQILKT
jgi:hypothetical protein